MIKKDVKIGDKVRIPVRFSDDEKNWCTAKVIGIYTHHFLVEHKNGLRECVLYCSNYQKI